MGRSIEEIRKAYPYSENCFELDSTIKKAINQRSFTSTQMSGNEVSVLNKRLEELNDFYNKKKCDETLGADKLNKLNLIIDKYQDIDKIRIEAESFEQRNKRIYIGIGIFLAGLGIILIVNKKNK
jgi:hypothetical protein